MVQSAKLFKRAEKHIPGGVNSPVRAFRAVGGAPRFISRGRGAHIWDAEGKRYLDFVMSWGPLILGHAHPKVVHAICRQAVRGTTFGASTENEIRLAELIKSAFPSIQKVRLVSSGTEAVMSAIRLARGATGRRRIIKCDGGYHGHADSLLVRAGSGATTLSIADSRGVPQELARFTISIPFNDADALERVLKKYRGDIACFIVEPIPANMGVVLPKPGYLRKVRALTKRYGALLIFDEVITGFRVAFGGAQELFGVRADLTCLGKVVGGGLPIGAFGGAANLMNELAPLGQVYQAGTLSGNPIATAAGIATLSHIKDKSFYRALNKKSDRFLARIDLQIKKCALPVTINRIGSAFTFFITPGPVTDYVSAKRSHTKQFAKLFKRLLSQGIYLTPSQFEANFVSAVHEPADLEKAGKLVCKNLELVTK